MRFPTIALGAAAVFAISSWYFHRRGAVRFRWQRQLADYSTLLAPYNAFACLCSALPARPIHSLDRFPELGLLRENWHVIRDEARAVLAAGAVQQSERQDDIVFYSFFKRGWKRFYLSWYRGFLPSARERCPRTVALLERVPCVRGAMFALMEPHSKLGKHRDPFAGALRYHLGLITPNSPDCHMFVDDVQHVWTDGGDVLFDSSYIHRAVNRTDAARVVLFCDVERPMRGPVTRAINRLVLRWVVPITQTPNVAGERVGIANRVFAALQPLRRWINEVKARSTIAYYGLKTAAFVAILLLLWRV